MVSIHDNIYGHLQQLSTKPGVRDLHVPVVRLPLRTLEPCLHSLARITSATLAVDIPIYADRVYNQDPLWDGRGCGSTSTCCQFNNPPWFCKDLPQPTTDDIELRLCVDQVVNEDIILKLAEVYVQL